jgi:hypothetical protein
MSMVEKGLVVVSCFMECQSMNLPCTPIFCVLMKSHLQSIINEIELS